MKLRLAVLLVTMGLAGVAAAGFLVSSASAWDVTGLPQGFVVVHATDISLSTCPAWYWVQWTGTGAATVKLCVDSPTFQADLDSFVNAHYTAPATTAATTTAVTTAPATTTDAGTTTTAPVAPPVTTTVTQTVTQPAAGTQPAATTTYVTVTTASPVEQSLQDQINALAVQLKAVTDRVTRLEKAGDASWLTFQQAASQGVDTAIAAAMARQTWLDVVNQTGAYAPTP
jgi:hypothetical protein